MLLSGPNLSLSHVLTIFGKTSQFQMVWPTLAEVYMIKTDQTKNQDIFPFQRFLALSVMQVSKTLSRKPTELVSRESIFWSSQFSRCFRILEFYYDTNDELHNFSKNSFGFSSDFRNCFAICEVWIRQTLQDATWKISRFNFIVYCIEIRIVM